MPEAYRSRLRCFRPRKSSCQLSDLVHKRPADGLAEDRQRCAMAQPGPTVPAEPRKFT